MIKITLEHYFRDYRERYALDFNPDIERRALRLIDLANSLLQECENRGVILIPNAAGNMVRSGWRPPAVNAAKGGAKNSLHMVGGAIDIEDVSNQLDTFLYEGWLHNRYGSPLDILGVWCEQPSATESWCHLQDVPPLSKNRFFYP